MNRRVIAIVACVSFAAVVAGVSCKANLIEETNNASCDATLTVTVDGAGARVIGPDGAEADIPAGALTEATDITICRVHGSYSPLPAGWQPAVAVYSFEPHSQVFLKPVDIRTPYVDPGKPVQLATSEPAGAWSTVVDADLAGGFAHVSSTHFSFYSVVTGAGPDDAGSDAAPDVAPPPMPDAAPFAQGTPSPSLFASVPTLGVVYRFALTESVFVDGGVADAGDAGDGAVAPPSVEAGANDDGGSWTVPGSSSLAWSPPLDAGAPYALFTSTHAYATSGGSVIRDDAGLLVATDGGIAQIVDPFHTPSLAGAFHVDNPGAMTFGNGELWAAIGSPPDVETFAGGAVTWAGSSVGMVTGAAGYGGIAYDVSTTPATLFLSVRRPDAVQRWAVQGQGSLKSAVKLTDIATNLAAPAGLAIAPWGELLVVNAGSGIARFDAATGAPVGTYTAAALGITPASSIAVTRWPDGTPELFVVDGPRQEIARFVFVSAAHNVLQKIGAIPIGADVTALVVAP